MAQAKSLGHFSFCPETASETPALLITGGWRFDLPTIRWKVYHTHTGKSKESRPTRTDRRYGG